MNKALLQSGAHEGPFDHEVLYWGQPHAGPVNHRGFPLELDRGLPGSRMIARAEFDLDPAGGEPFTLVLESQRRFLMRGLGYSSAEWSHGAWHDDLAIGSESWTLSGVEPLDPTAQHVHHLVRASVGDARGIGLLEQIIYGPHHQFGFTDILDGAP